MNKRHGTMYEFRFFSRILDQGYDLFIPAGDDLPVDCVVQNGAGKLFKVQIKGTGRAETKKRKDPRYKVLVRSTAQRLMFSVHMYAQWTLGTSSPA